jgi:hypothetical protein
VEAVTAWRGSVDTTRWRLGRLVLISLVLQSPFTPLAALFGLFGLLQPAGPAPPAEDEAAITAIPIDLVPDDQLERGGAGEPKPEVPPEKAAAQDDPFKDLDFDEPAEKAAPVETVDAGSEDELDAGTDAGADALIAQADAAPADGGAAGAGKAIGDPVVMSGSAGRLVDANANVRLIIYNDRIRNHPMGLRIGTLLSQAYQWRDFFGPAKLDPIRDVDVILLAGPQLRDSSSVLGVLRYNVSEEKMKKAVDALVQRDTAAGGWMDAGVPAATARADRASRIFAFPAPHILVVAPPSAADSALKAPKDLRFPAPKGPEALTTFVTTPWRAFIGVPFKVPRSIKSVRMHITPTADGGAIADLVAKDESEAAAKKDAQELQQSFDAITQVKLGVLGALLGRKEHKIIERVTFTARGDEIHGTVIATPKQLAGLLEAVAQAAKQIAEENARKAQAKADGGAAPGQSPSAEPPAKSEPDEPGQQNPEPPPSEP